MEYIPRLTQKVADNLFVQDRKSRGCTDAEEGHTEEKGGHLLCSVIKQYFNVRSRSDGIHHDFANHTSHNIRRIVLLFLLFFSAHSRKWKLTFASGAMRDFRGANRQRAFVSFVRSLAFSFRF